MLLQSNREVAQVHIKYFEKLSTSPITEKFEMDEKVYEVVRLKNCFCTSERVYVEVDLKWGLKQDQVLVQEPQIPGRFRPQPATNLQSTGMQVFRASTGESLGIFPFSTLENKISTTLSIKAVSGQIVFVLFDEEVNYAMITFVNDKPVVLSKSRQLTLMKGYRMKDLIVKVDVNRKSKRRNEITCAYQLKSEIMYRPQTYLCKLVLLF